MASSIVYPRDVRDLAPDALAAPGRPRVMPAAYYRETTRIERAVFGAQHGLYGFPTLELVAWVKKEIAGRTAIEIGAGHGAFAEALGIPATDNWMQDDPLIAAHYASLGQPVVRYGHNVERLDAAAAVAKYQPQVVVASWVTHKYEDARHAAGGNMFGVDEAAIIDACEAYIFVGNRHVHRDKIIWDRVHQVWEPDWVFSRASNGTPDFVAIWNRAG